MPLCAGKKRDSDAVNGDNTLCYGYKAFNNDLSCRDYQYYTDKTHTFNGNVSMCESGFHFCRKLVDVLNFYNFIKHPDYRVFKVKSTGTILHYKDKSVTNNLILLEEIKDLQTPELCMAAVTQNGDALEFVEHQTPELCMTAVTQTGWSLEFVKSQTPEICMAAVIQNGNSLQFVKSQTPEICMAAVKKYGLALQFVKSQTPELCMAAVTQDGRSLRYVKSQTPEICMAAVTQNGRALRYVKSQTPELCMAATQS